MPSSDIQDPACLDPKSTPASTTVHTLVQHCTATVRVYTFGHTCGDCHRKPPSTVVIKGQVRFSAMLDQVQSDLLPAIGDRSPPRSSQRNE